MFSSDKQLVALKCELSPGGFSGERIFEIWLANGDLYKSIAPRQFCWNEEGKLVEENEPSDGNKIPGKVAARLIDHLDENQVIVEVPDGQIIAVNKEDIIVPRPTPIKPPTYVSV